MKKLRDSTPTAEIIGVVLNVVGPTADGEPAVRQACAQHEVGVATTTSDRPYHFMRRHAISRGGAGDSQPMVLWHESIT
ncbi:hypothetical protein Pyn_37026 [Prunus yedoensis var. nudiflora]|uniref:Uncharacterized protein n=1 Tax=Prunus yedoensis var. nudiflora TaxID=2094558 RepID=A0A314XZN4_PRUYE|nr:hypothetical protein Pyn_37026 [Prunus yedoensis var. nudiflora]